MEQHAEGYTLKDAAQIVGCSPAFIRKMKRSGQVHPSQVRGRRGMELRFSPSDVDTLRALYTRPRKHTDSATVTSAIIAADVLREQVERLQRERDDLLSRAVTAEAESSAMSARVLGLQSELAGERERVTAERQRVEALKALGVWDRVRGRHKGI